MRVEARPYVLRVITQLALYFLKIPEIFDEEARPMVAPTPPATKAITRDAIMKKELLCFTGGPELIGALAGRHHGDSEGAGN